MSNRAIVVLACVVGVVLGALACMFGAAVDAQDRWTTECRSIGGHVVQLYRSSVCVSKDGRILE